jgi:Peptidase A4 family
VPERPEIWLVVRGEELIAELDAERLDPPWFCGHVTRRSGFWALQALFDREQQLARRVHRDPAAWAHAYRRVRSEVRLLRPDGHPASEFILHIDGPRARWRCWNRESTNWLDEQLAASPPTRPTPQRIARRVTAALIGALAAALALPGAALAHTLHHQQTDNWAGYAVTAPAPFRSVSGKWVQPTANCDQHTDTYAAFWVGLGGFNPDSQKLEQIGTESDCTDAGNTNTFAWYELLPHPPVTIRIQIHPGDRIAAHVRLSGDLVHFRIQNLTTHRTFARTIPFALRDTSSAEWIAEAPSACNGQQCQPLPLTNFNTIQFTNATATTATGRSGSITNNAFTTTDISLSAGAGTVGPPAPPPPTPGSPPGKPVPSSFSGGGAIPTHPSHDGADFTVRYTPGDSTPHRASRIVFDPGRRGPHQLPCQCDSRGLAESEIPPSSSPISRRAAPQRCSRSWRSARSCALA